MSSPASFVTTAVLVCLLVGHAKGFLPQFRSYSDVCGGQGDWPHLSYDADTQAVRRVRDGLGLQQNVLSNPVSL